MRLLIAAAVLAAAACADTLSGPGRNACILAYSFTPAPPLQLAAGDSVAVTASRIAGCGGRWPVTWRTDAQAVAAVRSTADSTAIITGISPGVTNITVSNGDRTGFLTISVN